MRGDIHGVQVNVHVEIQGPSARRPAFSDPGSGQLAEAGSCLSEQSADTFKHSRPIENDYEVTDEVLGVGMCGEVRVAVAKISGDKVAVKSFEMDDLAPRELVDLKHEIVIQSSVNHPNVARLHRWYESNGRVHLILERLEGGTGLDLLDKGKVGEAKAAAVIAQVLEAVEYLHGKGIMHRDIKLENIMFEDVDADKVRLIDFGLARNFKEGSRPFERVCGTAFYMAPEVLQKSYTMQADLWSIGIVAHELLTNELPKLDLWTMRPIYSERLKKCSPEAQRFVHGLLTEASGRMTASEALNHSWIRAKEPETQQAAGRSRWPRIFPNMTFKSRGVSAVWGLLGRRKTRVAPVMTEVVPSHAATSLS